MHGAIPQTPQYIFMVWCLFKHRATIYLPLPDVVKHFWIGCNVISVASTELLCKIVVEYNLLNYLSL
jgi:hypothetical protein